VQIGSATINGNKLVNDFAKTVPRTGVREQKSDFARDGVVNNCAKTDSVPRNGRTTPDDAARNASNG